MFKPNYRAPETTTLWSLVESMQRRLERQGLDADTVDVVVTRGLAAMLLGRTAGAEA